MKKSPSLSIYFTNDLHSHIPESIEIFNKFTVAKKTNNSLVIDIGDFCEGSAFYNLFKGKPELKLLNRLYNFIIPGNHGFQDVVGLYRKGFPVLTSNLLYEGKQFFEKDIVYDSSDSHIAFIGIMSPEAFISIEAEKRQGFSVKDPYKVLPKLISKFKRLNYKIVLLSHSGFAYDVELARNISGIDVIISSHCHSKYFEKRVNNTLVIKAFEHGKGHGILELKNDLFSFKKVSIHKVTPFFLAETLFLKEYLEKYNRKLKKEFFYLPPGFTKRFKNRRQLTHYFLNPLKEEFKVDLAIINYHCFRALLPNIGVITMESIYNLCPLENDLYVLEVSRDKLEKKINILPKSLKMYLCLNKTVKTLPKTVKLVTTTYLANNAFADFREKGYNTGMNLRSFVVKQLMREAKGKNDINWIEDKQRSNEEKDHNRPLYSRLSKS